MTGWLDTKGFYYQLQGNDYHEDFAKSLGETIENLSEKGWMRVSYFTDTLYISNYEDVPLNFLQKKAVEDMFIENKKMSIVRFENGRCDTVLFVREE